MYMRQNGKWCVFAIIGHAFLCNGTVTVATRIDTFAEYLRLKAPKYEGLINASNNESINWQSLDYSNDSDSAPVLLEEKSSPLLAASLLALIWTAIN